MYWILSIINTFFLFAIFLLVLRIRQAQVALEESKLTDEESLEENLSSRLRQLQTAQFGRPVVLQRPYERKKEDADEKRS